MCFEFFIFFYFFAFNLGKEEWEETNHMEKQRGGRKEWKGGDGRGAS